MKHAYGLAPRLVAERLDLRPPRAEDAGPVSLYLGDARVAKMLTGIPHPYPPGAAEALIERAQAALRSGPLFVMDAARSGGPEVIGLIFVNKGEGEGVFSLGYCVGPPFWNTGYATEALQTVIASLFEGGAEALTAVVFHDNPASARVLSNLGFAFEGDGEAFCNARGVLAPIWRYRLERGSWRAA